MIHTLYKLPADRLIAFVQSMSFTSGQMIWLALYIAVAEHLGLSLSQVLITFALGSGLYLFGSPFWANKSETWGRQNVLRLSMCAQWLTFFTILILCIYRPSPSIAFILLILIRSFYGLIAAAIPVVAQSLHADYADITSSPKAMLSHSLSLNIGRILGLLIVLIFSGNINHTLIFYCFITSVVLFFSFIPLEKKNTHAKNKSKIFASSWKQEFLNIRWIFSLALVFAFFGEAVNTSLGPSLKLTLLITSTQTSQITAYLLLAACLGVAMIQLISRIFIKQNYTLWFYIGFLSLFIGSLLYINANSLPFFWLAVIFFIVGLGLVPPLYLSFLRSPQQTSTNYGKRAGLVSTAHTLGSACGVGASSFAVAFYDHRSIGWVLITLVILMFLFTSLIQKK